MYPEAVIDYMLQHRHCPDRGPCMVKEGERH